MDNQKLANEKLNQVVELLKEVSELKADKCAFILMATALAPEKGENVAQQISAIYGNNVNLLRSVCKAMQDNEGIKDTLKVAATMGPIEYAILNAMTGEEMKADDETPCDCPNCTAEREYMEKLANEDAETNMEPSAPRSKGKPFNPNIN